MQISWDELKNNPEKLAEMANRYSATELAEKYGLYDHSSVTYQLRKHGYSYDQQKRLWVLEDESEPKESKVPAEDDVPENEINIEEKDNGVYIIHHPTKGEIRTTEEQMNDLRFYYCQIGLTQDETTRKLSDEYPGFDFEKFKVLKKAFHVVHDSIPLQKKTIEENDHEELAEDLIKREEEEFLDVYKTKKLRKLEKENRKLRKKKYIVHEVKKKLLPQVQERTFEPPRFNIQPEKSSCDYLVMSVDWHTGKRVDASKILGEKQGFNRNIFRERVKRYMERVISGIKADRPEKIYFVDLGDTADGRDIYEDQAEYQDLYGYEQCVEAAEATEQALLTIYDYNPCIEYIKIPGNHSRNDDSDLLIGELVRRGLKDYQDHIKFDVAEKEYKSREIRGVNHVFTHGNNIRTGTYTRAKDVMSIIQLMQMHDKYTYVHQGHLNHLAKEGARHNHWLWPSIVGGDDLGNNKMQGGARASQVFVRLTDEGISAINPVYFESAS